MKLKRMSAADRTAVIDILNCYIETAYTAYPDKKVEYRFFDTLLKDTEGYPALTVTTAKGEVIGFGFLRSFHPLPVFAPIAEISYFLREDYVGKGLGKLLLERLAAEARTAGIERILACICVINERSIRFHQKHGFEECGRYRAAGKKKGGDPDILWMQKRL